MDYRAAEDLVTSAVSIKAKAIGVGEDIRLIIVNQPCPLCQSWLEIVTHVHAEKHAMTRAEYMAQCFPDYNRTTYGKKAYTNGIKYVTPINRSSAVITYTRRY